jgi:hypothetical protein
MAAYNLVSATASYVITRRNWSEGGWDSNNWNQVGESAILERGLRLAADAYKFESLYPNSNITQTGFTGGFAQIDEAIASDADFVYGSNDLSVTLEVGLTDPVGVKNSSTQNTVTYRYAKVDSGVLSGTGNAVTVTASIYEGATLIATDISQTATGTWQERTFTFNSSSVINLNNLSIRFTSPASGGTGTARRGIAISWAKVDVSVATYTEIGKDAFFSRKYAVVANAGGFVLTRNPANLIRTRRFIADTGLRIVAGINAILKKGYYLLAAKSTYSTTGGVSFGYKGYKVIASAGSFPVAGKAANLFRYARLAADPRAFTVNGQAAITKKGFKVAAEFRAYAIEGKENAFKRYYVVTSDKGTYLLSGRVATTKKGFHIAGNRGIYTVIGRVASLYRKLIADKGTVTISGNAAGTRAGRRMSASAGNVSLTGNEANLKYARKVIAQNGEYLIRSSVAYLRYIGYGFLIPDSDISQTGFTGTFADIDETDPLDSDFIYGANNTAATIELGLRDPRFLPVNGTCTVKYRIARVNSGVLDGGGNAVTVTASVYQGASLIATGITQTATGTWTQYSFTFDASTVSDWSDLRLRFVTSASGGTGQSRRGAAISWARMELPLVAEKYDTEIFGGYVEFEFGNVPYILASPGSYSASGQGANLIRSRLFLADAASIFVATKAATLARSRRFSADAGSFAATGIANNWKRGIRLLSERGQFATGGNANNFRRSIVFNAATGNFAINGIQAVTRKGFIVTGSRGLYAVTGNNANLLRNRRIQCSNGTFVTTGKNAGTAKGFKVISNNGSYLVSGNTNIFRRTYVFVASKGAYIVIGYSAQSQGQYAVTGQGGSYLITGTESFYKRNYVATSTAIGQVELTGKDGLLKYGRTVLASSNDYSIVGNTSNFRLGLVVIAGSGSHEVLGGSVSWIKTIRSISETGSYQVSGNIAITIWGLRFPVANGQYIISGEDIRLRYKRRRQKMLLIL